MPVALPLRERAALLLDIDGTLIDLAPTPDAVVVEAGLLDTLRKLRRHLGDALAVVTGRPVEQADALLGGAPFAVAGEHGGAIRHRPDGPIERPPLPEVPAHWLPRAEEAVAAYKGALLERKRRGLVLHFRQAPESGSALHAAAQAMVAERETEFQLLETSRAWEIRPRGMDKGVAVERLCALAPFAGRLPIFIGDDVTDEDGIRMAHALGGTGFRVDRAFGSPADVRAWLARSADRFDAGEDSWAPTG
ncbi:MAG: trehalose-phosphatase [Acetobacteraceae bacterium]|nr:trehalose-phosphatase [Acetobacteraceae bacterium]